MDTWSLDYSSCHSVRRKGQEPVKRLNTNSSENGKNLIKRCSHMSNRYSS